MSNFAPRLKRSHSLSPIRNSSPSKPEKVKLSPSSPFPDFSHPTPDESRDIFQILQAEFPTTVTQNLSSDDVHDKNSASTCGNVPNVIEALIGTILSQNTSAPNSTRAKQDLDAAFGLNNFSAIAHAPRAEVVQAIKHGGLANKKAATIQHLLAAVHAKHGVYSLQHLADAVACPDADAMRELVAYDGVGPKTASCVLLFCLGRQSFPVDTHVFRLSRVLGWVPPSANRVSAQAHLDVRIPGELKYGLHVLLIAHGRKCSGCKNRGKGPCSLKTWVKKPTKEEDV